jgi:acyl carrier protein
MYCTGDSVRLTANNEILYVGRIDRQVKVRGHRVELSEVENSLMQITGIEQVGLITHQGELDREIVCFYSSQQAQLTGEIIRKLLKDMLPDYMIPSRFIKIATFPITSSGKINYQQLTSKVSKHSKSNVDNPVSNMTVMDCFKNILNLEEIDINTDFYSLGGNSLQAIRLISLINKHTYANLTFKSFTNAATICAIERNININTQQPESNYKNKIEEF